MKEIATISPERLNNGAHYQFMTNGIELCSCRRENCRRDSPQTARTEPYNGIDQGRQRLENLTERLSCYRAAFSFPISFSTP